MITNLERYKKDLSRLISEGGDLLAAMIIQYSPKEAEQLLKALAPTVSLKNAQGKLPAFVDCYQLWYSEARALVKQLLPDRIDDFVSHYNPPGGARELTMETYRIQHALQFLTRKSGRGDLLVGPSSALTHMQQQLNILRAVERRFESSLFDIRQLVQADLFDSEIASARELAEKGFLRAAGAVAGVVLEKHLAQVMLNHSLIPKKSHPTISDFNDALKSGGVVDLPQWRQVQRLGDIRNLCDHGKGREPTKEEVLELVDGTDKLAKTLF